LDLATTLQVEFLMTYRHVKWAQAHDWYLYHYGEAHTGITVVCRDEYTQGGVLHSDQVEFTSFHEMWAWAGY
jgi:hypothetical protein